MNEYYCLKHITLNRISVLKHYALKHIVNSLNDGTYYVNINFNVCHNNNLFHIYIYIYIYINNHLFELARERERGMKVVRAPASARLSIQAMRLSYFKNSDYPSLQRNITLRVSSQSKLFY